MLPLKIHAAQGLNEGRHLVITRSYTENSLRTTEFDH